MSPRLLDSTSWLWCVLVFYAAPPWKPVSSVTVKSPPNTPATVEAQAKFFQYRNLPTHEDYDQGHRQGSERHFTERHERARPGEGLFSAKVRWGDKKGGYGEHYWDLNHAGHADNHHDDGDDGSYRVHDNEDPFDEPSEQQASYNDEYDPEQAASYEESNRIKRHHRAKADKKGEDEEVKTLRRRPRVENKKAKENYDKKTEEHQKFQPARSRDENKKDKEDSDESTEEYQNFQPARSREDNKKAKEDSDKNTEEYQNIQPARLRYLPKELNYDEDQQNVHAPISTTTTTQPPQILNTEQPRNDYVPYEGGAGVRQHRHAEVAAVSVPRLFLEPYSGHVIDRATGQAYILQPIVANYQ